MSNYNNYQTNYQPAVLTETEIYNSLLEKKTASALERFVDDEVARERLSRMVLVSVRKNPLLLRCSKQSFAVALLDAAQLKLEIDLGGEAYITPMWNSKNKCYDAALIPGYKGLIKIARRNPKLSDISVHCVYKNEPFSIKYGIEETIEHSPLPPEERGEIMGVYAVARYVNGTSHFEFMWLSEVNKIRDKVLSKIKKEDARNSSTWVTEYDSMVRKTGVRRLFNFIACDTDLKLALESSDKEYDSEDIERKPSELDNILKKADVKEGEPKKEEEDKEKEKKTKKKSTKKKEELPAPEEHEVIEMPKQDVEEAVVVGEKETANETIGKLKEEVVPEKDPAPVQVVEDSNEKLADVAAEYDLRPGSLVMYIRKALNAFRTPESLSREEELKVIEIIKRIKTKKVTE